jgi:hypothetical protein
MGKVLQASYENQQLVTFNQINNNLKKKKKKSTAYVCASKQKIQVIHSYNKSR